MKKRRLPSVSRESASVSQPTDMFSTLAFIAASIAPVPDSWVDAVEHIESSGRGADTPAGDTGQARGPFQFWHSAWMDCSDIRRQVGLPTYPYKMATDPVIARQYAQTWLAHLRSRVSRRLGRPANAGETWLAFNMGMTGFGSYGYNMQKVPDRKFMKAHQININVR